MRKNTVKKVGKNVTTLSADGMAVTLTSSQPDAAACTMACFFFVASHRIVGPFWLCAASARSCHSSSPSTSLIGLQLQPVIRCREAQSAGKILIENAVRVLVRKKAEQAFGQVDVFEGGSNAPDCSLSRPACSFARLVLP